RHAVSLTQAMPQSYERELAKIPHVTHVVPMQWFGGQYKDPKNFFANFAVGHEQFFDMFPDYTFTDGAKEAFENERIAALVGEELMKQFGWSIGDRVTLTGTIFPVDLEFRIVGTFKSDIDKNSFYFRYDYMRESGADYGMVGAFWLMADKPENVPAIIDAVDARF